MVLIRDDNGAGRGGVGPKDRVSAPTPSRMTGKISCPFPPLGAPRSPAPPHKTLLHVNLPITITIFFNKTCFYNKNILKITKNFIPSNQTYFLKKLNNITKVFNNTISQQKQKSHNAKSMIQ